MSSPSLARPGGDDLRALFALGLGLSPQTLAEIAVEKNSTILFPLPLEPLRVFEKLSGK